MDEQRVRSTHKTSFSLITMQTSYEPSFSDVVTPTKMAFLKTISSLLVPPTLLRITVMHGKQSTFFGKLARLPIGRGRTPSKKNQYLTGLIDADEKSRDSYLRYMSEAETYNFVTSEKRGRGYGSGVHKEYTFIDDPEVVAETLRKDFRLEDVENNDDLIKSVINAQVKEFFDD